MTPSPSPRTERSYRALLTVPGLGRILTSMMFARIAQAMVGVALVLFTLDEYGSPALTGIVTAASVLPGLLIAPIAGALLDRQGRTKLVMLDYAVALASLVLIGGLAHLDALPVPLLLAITIVSSLTSILSATGLRSLFPLLVPERLWERVNAIDSNGYLVATIVGPPLAADPRLGLRRGHGADPHRARVRPGDDRDDRRAGPATRARRHRATSSATPGTGVKYTLRNATLRGLGVSISLLNVSGGMVTIVVPLIVITGSARRRYAVGLVFAASGVAGVIAALIAGRLDTRGREWDLLVLPMGGIAAANLLLIVGAGSTVAATGIAIVALALAIGGVLNGPMDIGLFTIRQRRTDPAWMGRAFAVSMGLNFLGYPIGTALAGVLATQSIELAIVVGAMAAGAAGVVAAILIPRRAPDAKRAPVTSAPAPAPSVSPPPERS